MRAHPLAAVVVAMIALMLPQAAAAQRAPLRRRCRARAQPRSGRAPGGWCPEGPPRSTGARSKMKTFDPRDARRCLIVAVSGTPFHNMENIEEHRRRSTGRWPKRRHRSGGQQIRISPGPPRGGAIHAYLMDLYPAGLAEAGL